MIFENGPVVVAETKPIWRYVGLPALLVYLDRKLRLQSVESLKRIDPAEGIPIWNAVTQSEAFEEKERSELYRYVYSQLSRNDKGEWDANKASQPIANQKIVYEQWRNIVNTTRYAICFIESIHESMAMWRLFAPNGFAIKSSIKHLKAALSRTGRDWRVSGMRYWDRSQEITPDHSSADPVLKTLLRHPHFLKGAEYSQENEVRLVTVDPDGRPTLFIEDVSPSEWILEIRISPEIWPQDAVVLKSLIQERCPQLKDRISISSVPLGYTNDVVAESWLEHTADLRQQQAEKWPSWLRAP